MKITSTRLASAVLSTLMCSTTFAGTQLKMSVGVFETKKLQAQNQIHLMKTQGVQEWIVQFKKPVTEVLKQSLKSQGLEVLGYLPEDALVVRGNASAAALLQGQANVEAVIAYMPEFKISKNINGLSIFSKAVNDVFVLKSFKEQDLAQVLSVIRLQLPEAQVLAAQGKSVLVKAPLSMAYDFAKISGVEHVQLDPQLKTMEMSFGEESQASVLGAGDYSDLAGDESGTKVMKFDSAWAQGLTGKGQIASMADTGLDSGKLDAIHQDFSGAVVSGHIMGMFGKSWEDPMGHGTHVAGSIMGRGAASRGVLKGGAPEAGLVAEGMWSPMLGNLSVPSKLGDLFTKAYADGARIHSNSWGGARTFGSYDNFAIQVDEWMWNNPDMLILFAAGNSGIDKDKDGRIDPNSMASPGTAKNVLTVGASENVTKTGGIQVPISKLRIAKDNWGAEPIYSSLISDNANGVSMFSSRGPTQDGRIKPDIVAPGTNILSVRSQHKDAQELWGAYNKDYVWSGGTSMATPLTAGAATVVRQYLVEKRGMTTPSAALMKAYMIHNAVDMYPGQYGEVGASRGQELLTRRPNSDEGFGRVDVEKLVQLSSANALVDNKSGIAQGAEVAVSFRSNGGKFLANLVWTDAPGSANAAQALVNDLDLALVGPSGVMKLAQDRLNNHEIIEIENLPAGDYQVVVRGYKIPQGRAGKQPYALVYSF